MGVLYTTRTCPACHMVKKYLKLKGIDYKEFSAEQPEYGREAQKLSGQVTVPVLVLNGQVITGFNVRAINEAIQSVAWAT